jgi:hypothetical protein
MRLSQPVAHAQARDRLSATVRRLDWETIIVKTKSVSAATGATSEFTYFFDAEHQSLAQPFADLINEHQAAIDAARDAEGQS